MKQLIIKLRKKIIDFSPKFEYKTLQIWLKIRTRYAYIKKKGKIDKQYRKEIKEYWKPYKNISTRYHKVYLDINNTKDVRFIPSDIYHYYIERYFNKTEYGAAIDDKNYYDILLKDVKQPKTVIKNIDNVFYDGEFNLIEENTAVELINKKIIEDGEVLIKPAIDSCGGSNVKIIDKTMNIREILKEYKSNYIIQCLIKQSKELSKIHPESVNTIRIISLLYKGTVIILSSLLRMGVNDSRIDNFSKGGISCGINADGTLKSPAFDKLGNSYVNHPGGGTFTDYKINGYDKVIDIIEKQHKKFAHFKLISWDFAIDENYEPVFIEFNLKVGQLDFHQFSNGPLFGNITDEILEEVFKKK